MRRLNFILPEWTRVAWASAEAKAVWEPRVARVTAAWATAERLAVARGAKPSALQNVAPQDLPDASVAAAGLGLVALPLGRVGAAGSYTAASKPVEAGRDWVYRVVYTTSDLAADWGAAWAHSDDEAIGRLLGFPPCCRAFFARRWADERMVDLTWPAALAGGEVASVLAGGTIDVAGPPEANILGRWVGVRLVSHMPCSFGCAASAAIGRKMLEVLREVDAEAAAWAYEALSWPAEWSALHGIAEVVTPVWKVSTRTDATADKHVVRYYGDCYPAEGASGGRFPFRAKPQVVPLTALRAKAFAKPATDWTDNGFADAAAMEAAHAVVASVARPGSTVLDLGCGNGKLARRIAGASFAAGVDVKAPAGGHVLDAFIIANIANIEVWKDRTTDVTLLMPGRLVEREADLNGDTGRAAAAVREALKGRTVLVYAYGDWLTRYGSLDGLCRAAGLPVPDKVAVGVQAAAALIEVH